MAASFSDHLPPAGHNNSLDEDAILAQGSFFSYHRLVGPDEDEDEEGLEPVTPWVRSVASGVELLRNPKYNKGTAFTLKEREKHHLLGLLPPQVMSQDEQVQRVLSNLADYPSDMQRYIHLMALQERNERLFYRVLIDHLEQVMPIVYTPTVGSVCQKYGLLFRRPRGLFISIDDRGRVMKLLKNWPERAVRVIVVTDGERILGLGDLGAQGMGIPVGKLSLYTAIGGIHPSQCLPITIDVGTNNDSLKSHPFYPGLRRNRCTGEPYLALLDEFVESAKARYGRELLIQFEDFANRNAFALLSRYRDSSVVFNDDIQGTAAVAVAGLLASTPLTKKSVSQHKYLFLGAGEAGTGIAELLATVICREANVPLKDARRKIWLVDSHGLVVKSRLHQADQSEQTSPSPSPSSSSPPLANHKVPFAHDHPPCPDFESAVKALKPSALVGVSGKANGFTKSVCAKMAEYNTMPIIFALSNPTANSECTAQEAYDWTSGRCIFASGSPFPEVHHNGIKYKTGQANNAYIFPAIGLACTIADISRITDEMFLVAAEALADQVTDADRETGSVFPPICIIRKVTAGVAAAVAAKAYESGLALKLPKPKDLKTYALRSMYDPRYRKFA